MHCRRLHAASPRHLTTELCRCKCAPDRHGGEVMYYGRRRGATIFGALTSDGEAEQLDDNQILALLTEALHAAAPETLENLGELNLDVGIQDLGLDSLRMFEMIGFVEDRLARTFHEDDLARARSLADIAGLI